MRMAKKGASRSSVHLHFRSHERGERMRNTPIRRETKTYLLEYGRGGRKTPMTVKEIDELFSGLVSPFSLNFLRDMHQKVSSMHRRGIRIVIGESELRKSTQLQRDISVWNVAYSKAREEPAEENIRKMYQAMRNFFVHRHSRIVRTIQRELVEGNNPINGRYGTHHSLLTRDLAKKGILSSRTIIPQAFSWGGIVLRKLAIGVRLKAIPPIEYKRAFLSDLWLANDQFVSSILGKTPDKMNDRDTRFLCLMDNVLLSRMPMENIDHILRTGNYSLIFIGNGIPFPPTQKGMVAFLRKHSPFWRKNYRHY
jgi:hypothetical protein